MVSGNTIEILSLMLSQGAKLSNNFFTFFIAWRALMAGEIAKVQGHIPIEAWCTVVVKPFGLPYGYGERFTRQPQTINGCISFFIRIQIT